MAWASTAKKLKQGRRRRREGGGEVTTRALFITGSIRCPEVSRFVFILENSLKSVGTCVGENLEKWDAGETRHAHFSVKTTSK